MSKWFFLFALLLTLTHVPHSHPRIESFTLSGIIYFTNNSPRNKDTFPVELFAPDQKTLVAATLADESGGFQLREVKPGKYLLKFTWPPDRCTLWYRVEVPKDSNTRIRVIMDAACSAHDGAIQDLPEN